MAHFGGRITATNNIDMLWYPPHIVWKLLKMSHFLTFFDLSGNTVWLQATQNVAFKILAFFIKYMLNETFSVIFEHCATSYLIPESWLIISFRLKNRLHLAVFYTHQSYQNKHLVTVLKSYDSCILTVLCPHLKIHCNFPLDWTS